MQERVEQRKVVRGKMKRHNANISEQATPTSPGHKRSSSQYLFLFSPKPSILNPSIPRSFLMIRTVFSLGYSSVLKQIRIFFFSLLQYSDVRNFRTDKSPRSLISAPRKRCRSELKLPSSSSASVMERRAVKTKVATELIFILLCRCLSCSFSLASYLC